MDNNFLINSSPQLVESSEVISALRLKAKKLRFEGRYVESIELLEHALMSGTDQANVLCDLGSIHFELKELNKGEAFFLMALQTNPNKLYALDLLPKKYTSWHVSQPEIFSICSSSICL